jgi:enoyl-CoA hydratase/carnithine racemase
MVDINITHEDRIATIMMSDREQKDTLSSETCGTIIERLYERARSMQWVVVAGEGGAFCSRTDLAREMDVASPAKAREGELIQRTNTASSAGACL